MVKLSQSDLERFDINPTQPVFREFGTVDTSTMRQRLERVLLVRSRMTVH